MEKKNCPILKKFAIALFSIVGLLFILLMCITSGIEETPEQKAAKEAGEKQERRTKQIESKLSGWDGSHKELTALIKSRLNDPESYEHLETIYFDQDSVIIFKTEYTAKNGFGGRVKGYVMAKADHDGNIIEIVESE